MLLFTFRYSPTDHPSQNYRHHLEHHPIPTTHPHFHAAEGSLASTKPPQPASLPRCRGTGSPPQQPRPPLPAPSRAGPSCSGRTTPAACPAAPPPQRGPRRGAARLAERGALQGEQHGVRAQGQSGGRVSAYSTAPPGPRWGHWAQTGHEPGCPPPAAPSRPRLPAASPPCGHLREPPSPCCPSRPRGPPPCPGRRPCGAPGRPRPAAGPWRGWGGLHVRFSRENTPQPRPLAGTNQSAACPAAANRSRARGRGFAPSRLQEAPGRGRGLVARRSQSARGEGGAGRLSPPLPSQVLEAAAQGPTGLPELNACSRKKQI